MFWLALIGLAITVAGGVIAAIGQDQSNTNQEGKIESQLPVYNAEQAAIQANLANIKAERKLAKQTEALNEKQIQTTAAYQETNIARQGAQAVGSEIAGAAKDNLGGASVLRRAQYLQDQTTQQLNYVSGQASTDIQKQQIGLKSTLGNLKVQAQGAQANLLQSQTNEANAQSDLAFLQKYGWMSTLAVGLGAGAQATNQAAQINWQDSSLATENYSAPNPYDYSTGGNLNLGGYT